MNIHAEKLKLIEWITKIRNKNPNDLWDELSETEKNEIQLGINDIEQGNTVEHSEVKNLYEKYL